MKPEEIISLLSQAEEFKPVVKKLIDTCESYKEQVSDFVDMVMYGIAQKKIDVFNYFCVMPYITDSGGMVCV